MDGIYPHFTVRTSFSFLLLILSSSVSTSHSASRADICSAPASVDFTENNSVGDTVTTITVQPGVTIALKTDPANPDNSFALEDNRLIATEVLDYETTSIHIVEIVCNDPDTGLSLGLIIAVIVVNVNDNPPVFGQDLYNINVNEMLPVDTSVDRIVATDLDGETIYYTLESESNGFKLRSSTNPDLLVWTPLDYDKVKNVQLILYAQDTPLGSTNVVSFTATTTIMVTIVDVDNRPPWFQPCIEYEQEGVLICQNTGYTGNVVLNEQETGVLPLKPGPIYAIDGDSGINEEITYSFLSGHEDGLFEINPNTGNISMLKPADVFGTISLTVLAAQKMNSYQFATTTVTISVQVKSLHLPQFQRSQYEGFVSAVGAMVMDLTNKDEPLRIIATDDDYAAAGGQNPYITYSISGSSDFSLIDGYLFMTKDLQEATLSLQVTATDSTNDESAIAELLVEVTSGLTTTRLPQSTTDSMGTTSIGESTTGAIVSTNPSTTAESITHTTNPSLTSEGSVSTASTVPPHTAIVASGRYGAAEMAAVGATLGVLLFICLVVIVVLVVHVKRERADWKKIYETSMSQRSLGQGSGGHKGGNQYTNDAFQNDAGGGSNGFGGPLGRSVMAGGEPRKAPGDFPYYEDAKPSVSPAVLRDDTSQADSDKTDNDKEVKPILTKERRMDDGYKSVWFKEDIDPNAKEEVVIIPDSRENDSEEEDEEETSSGREEDEDDSPRIKTPKIFFSDADLDSGLGVKIEDPAADSSGDEALTVNL